MPKILVNKPVLTLLLLLLVIGFGLVYSSANGRAGYYVGLLVSAANVAIFLLFYWYEKTKISRYPMQPLIKLMSNTVMRFVVVLGLLWLALTKTSLMAEAVLIGFLVGQLFFLFYKISLLAMNHGKR